MLRDRSNNEEDNQPMLQAANPIDAEKNHREYRDYMMKLYGIDIDDYLNDNESKDAQPVLRSSVDAEADNASDEERRMEEYLNMLKQMDEEEHLSNDNGNDRNKPLLREAHDADVDIDDMSEYAEYLKKL